MLEFQKEVMDKLEEAIRLGFQIAKDYSDIGYTYEDGFEVCTCFDEVECRYYIEFLDAERALEKKITEMRNAALGQGIEAA